MSQIERVNVAWDRIEKWYAEKIPDCELGAGAAAADITTVETHLGLTLPEELKASLMRHNGVGYWASGELFSTERIKDEWNVRAGLIDDGTLSDWNGWVEDSERMQTCWFSKSWIPIDSDCCGSSTCIDLNPGPKGKVGQIIFLDHDLGTKGPIFQDFAGYLENVADRFEGGKYRVTNGYPEEIF